MNDEVASDKLAVDRPAEAVARLRIRNPEKRNALDHEILTALAAALPPLAEGIETRCVIITGEGETFSAGYDIGGLPSESFAEDAEALVAHPFHEAMEAVSSHPYPVIAAVNGRCLGGGLELAVRCDLRICAAGAILGMPPARLGLIYGHTGLERFIEVIGVAPTKELFLVGDTLDARRAESLGLVNQVVADGEVERATVELAARIAANAPLSVRGNKRIIETLARSPHLTPEQEEELVELRRSCFRSEDFREGIRAFAEKREPRWRGR